MVVRHMYKRLKKGLSVSSSILSDIVPEMWVVRTGDAEQRWYVRMAPKTYGRSARAPPAVGWSAPGC